MTTPEFVSREAALEAVHACLDFEDGIQIHEGSKKKCANSRCKASSTPQWRKGPNACVLCNRCGVVWKKLSLNAESARVALQ
jgi:hypothetical protein